MAGLCSTLAFAQEGGTGSTCLDKCGRTVSDCTGHCGADGKCASTCMDRYSSCSEHCSEHGKLDKLTKPGAPKLKRCIGPNGKEGSCAQYSETKAPRGTQSNNFPDPKKLEEALKKDPNFKGFQPPGGMR